MTLVQLSKSMKTGGSLCCSITRESDLTTAPALCSGETPLQLKPTETIYMACLHCDYLVPEGKDHYCGTCGWNHTPEATWMDNSD